MSEKLEMNVSPFLITELHENDNLLSPIVIRMPLHFSLSSLSSEPEENHYHTLIGFHCKQITLSHLSLSGMEIVVC